MYNKNEPFKFWCQKVLPLVYDDSLSYYEVLCKLVKYLNKMMEDVNNLIDDMDSLKKSFDELKSFVDNYFLNLDVQEEINKKLDEMVLDGTLSEMVEKFINGNMDNASMNESVSNSTLEYATIHSLSNYYFEKNIVNVQKDMAKVISEGVAFDVFNKDGVSLLPRLSSLPHNNGGLPIGALCVGASFIGKDITYGRDTGIFNVNGQVFKQMVCSDFVWAVLNGISYGNSKAGGKPLNMKSVYRGSTFKNEKSLLAPVEKNAYITREIAWSYAGAGRLEEFDYKLYSNVQIGDIIFLSNLNDTADARNNYLGIGHCSIVANVDYNNRVVTAMECGTGSSQILRYSYVSKTTTDSRTPSLNELRIDPTMLDKNLKMYVARPSWNNIMPRKVYEQTFSGSFDVITDYTSMVQLLPEAQSLFDGDLVILRMHGNFNKLNPNLSQNEKVSFRIITNYSDQAYKVVSRSYYSVDRNIVTNDEFQVGVIQEQKNLTSMPLQVQSTINTNIVYSGSIQVYRL